MRSRLLLLGGQTIVLGLTMAFLVVPASALFLDQYGAVALPYVYLAVAVTGVAVSSAMSRAQRRLSLAGVAVRVVGTYVVAVATGWLVLVGLDGLWVTFPLLVLFPLSIPIGFVLVGSQAGRLLDVREMKAHFPRVAAGFSVGFALGGLAAAALVSPLGGPRHLLAVDVLAAGVMLLLVVATSRRFPDELRHRPERPDERVPSRLADRRRDTWRTLLSNRMVALILGYQLLSAAVTLLLDFMVWERAADRYSDPISLAQFQGLFGAVMNVVSVLFVVALGGWLLTRFGIGFGLAANPVGVLVLLCATSVVGYVVGPASSLFFALVCAQAVTDISLTDATTRTSINATYQALQPDERVRAQTMVEGAGVPLALGFVGLLLIGYNATGLDITAVVLVTLLLTALWLASAVLAFREYGVNLRGVLARRAWDPVALRIDDAASRTAVDQLLGSSDPHDVHAALDALVDTGRDVTEHVLALLADPEPARRELGLEIAVDTDRLGVPAVTSRVQGMLGDRDPDVALHAAASLVRLGVGHREAGRSAWMAAVVEEDLAMVGRALRAAGAFPHPFFVPYLVGLASSGSPSGDVLDALGAHCDHLAPRVRGLLADQSVPRQTRERVVHFLGMAARPRHAISWSRISTTVTRPSSRRPGCVWSRWGTVRLRRGSSSDRGWSSSRNASTDASRSCSCLMTGSTTNRCATHCATRSPQPLARSRCSWSWSTTPARSGRRSPAWRSTVVRDRSTALEMLEVTVGRSLGRMTLALVDPTLDAPTRHRLLAEHSAVESRTLGEWLRELVMDEAAYWSDPWLRACAMYALPGELPAPAAVTLVSPFLHDPDGDVAQTARWVTERWVEPGWVPLDAT